MRNDVTKSRTEPWNTMSLSRPPSRRSAALQVTRCFPRSLPSGTAISLETLHIATLVQSWSIFERDFIYFENRLLT